MNMKKAGLIGFLLLLAGIFFLNRKKVELTGQDNFELQPIGNSGFELRSVIHLNNPNLLSVTVGRIHERFYINRVQVGELDEDINQGIRGLKESEFPVSIRFSKEDITRATGGGINLKNIAWVVEGDISYNNFVRTDKIEVKKSVEWKQ